jgi:hypothetical protein
MGDVVQEIERLAARLATVTARSERIKKSLMDNALKCAALAALDRTEPRKRVKNSVKNGNGVPRHPKCKAL